MQHAYEPSPRECFNANGSPKLTFDSRWAAEDFLFGQRSMHPARWRIYRCSSGHWHFTSRVIPRPPR